MGNEPVRSTAAMDKGNNEGFVLSHLSTFWEKFSEFQSHLTFTKEIGLVETDSDLMNVYLGTEATSVDGVCMKSYAVNDCIVLDPALLKIKTFSAKEIVEFIHHTPCDTPRISSVIFDRIDDIHDSKIQQSKRLLHKNDYITQILNHALTFLNSTVLMNMIHVEVLFVASVENQIMYVVSMKFGVHILQRLRKLISALKENYIS